MKTKNTPTNLENTIKFMPKINVQGKVVHYDNNE